jgi:hypothetical protein
MAPGPHKDCLLFNKTGRFRTQFAQFTSLHFLKLDAGRLPLTHPAHFVVRIHESYINSSRANHAQKPRFTGAQSQ